MNKIEMIRQAPASKMIAKVGRFEVYRVCEPRDLGQRIACSFAIVSAGDVTLISFDEMARFAEVLPQLVDNGEIVAEVPKDVWTAAVQAKKDAEPRRSPLFC